MRKSIIISTLLLSLSLMGCSSDSSTSSDPGSPEISKVEPTYGTPGTVVTINGQGFSSQAKENTVKVNGKIAEVLSATEAQLQITIPDDASSGKLTIEVNGDSVEGPIFTLNSTINIGGNYQTQNYNIDLNTDLNIDSELAKVDTTVDISTNTAELINIGTSGRYAQLNLKDLLRNGLNFAISQIDSTVSGSDDITLDFDVSAEVVNDTLTINRKEINIPIPNNNGDGIDSINARLSGDGEIDTDGNITLNIYFKYDGIGGTANISNAIKLVKQ